MKISVSIITFLLAISFQAFSQHHAILSRFQAFKDKNRVILSWTIRQGNSCVGIGILRSTDSINFKPIGEIQGICGSFDAAQNFTYIDENPAKNNTNFYVLELGFAGKTEPPLAVEFIEIGESKSKVVPNPNNGSGNIYFFNPNNENHTLLVYDSHGKHAFIKESNQDYFSFSLDSMEEIEIASFNFPESKYSYIIINQANKIISSGIILSAR